MRISDWSSDVCSSDLEHDLLLYATEKLKAINSLQIIGEAADKAGVISFVMGGIHPHDIGTILDREGVAVRVGQHCAHPLMERFGVPATVRASFGLYNPRADKLGRASCGERVCPYV